jgi:hypothetical protein
MIASEKGITRRKVSQYVFKVRNKDQLDVALSLADYVITPPSLYKKHKKIWLCPPRWGEFTLPKGVTDIYAQNVGHLMFDCNIHAGFGLNIINNQAASFLSDLGINDITAGIEATKKDIFRMKCDILTVYAYGRFPLMLIRQKMKGNLIDRTGRRFPISDDEILNSVKLSLAGKEVNADRLLLDFYDETPKQMEDILKKFRDNINMDNITRGLYGF